MLILLVAAITFASRLAGALIMSRVPFSVTVERFLDGLSVSVIAALVASLVAHGDIRMAVSVAAASLIMLGSKSAVLAMLTGMSFAAAWSIWISSQPI